MKDYITFLNTHGKHPCAIWSDGGHKFLNDSLKLWCQAWGIEQQITALYSLSQNGVAKRMNRTLVELAYAMLISIKLSKFLWEIAITHATYL